MGRRPCPLGLSPELPYFFAGRRFRVRLGPLVQVQEPLAGKEVTGDLTPVACGKCGAHPILWQGGKHLLDQQAHEEIYLIIEGIFE